MATVLLYNFTDPERRGRVRFCLFRLGLSCVEVPPERQGDPLGLLLGLPGYAPGEAVEPFSGEMLVMHALSREQFGSLLEELRRSRVPVALKAVVTDTNIAWSSAQLHRELAAEHAAMAARARSVHRN